LAADLDGMTGPQAKLALAVAVVVTAQVTATFALNDITWTAPTFLFWAVVVAASLCVLTSVVLMTTAHRNDQAELGFVALFFVAVSLLPLVHGLTTPGVVYGDNSATSAAVFWAVPLGMMAMSPSLIRSTKLGRALAGAWRQWAGIWLVLLITLAATLLLRPNLVPVAAMGSPTGIVVGVLSLSATLVAAWRHANLAEIAENSGPLVVAVGYLLVGSSALVFIGGPAYAPHFWFAHVLDITGVFLATIGGIFVCLRSGETKSVLAPVVALDPHAALEIGLSPLVHRFVADLQQKDQITRDHVVRCGVLTIEVAVALKLSSTQIRQAGLVGLLHDIGKLEIPDDILTKPGRLTEEEFAVIKEHTVIGAELLREAPGLEELAPLVRGHHERIDGRGYPDGLRDQDIPYVSRLVAVCDAFDAMTVTRQYREGMPIGKAHAILREHAGAQWDDEIVAAVIALTSDPDRSNDLARPFAGVGHMGTEERIGCDCLPDLIEA